MVWRLNYDLSERYAFEKTSLEDVRVVDIPQILESYKQLVASHRALTSLLYGDVMEK